jgi:DNA-binding beta-propeller fold protein YncE
VRSRLLLTCLTVLLADASPRAADRPAFPDYRLVPGWPTLPGGFHFGQVSAAATDSSGRVYVLQRAEPPVLVFDADGRHLKSWGEGQVEKPHGLRIDHDDNVWVTDTGRHVVLKFDRDGRLLLTLGRRNQPGEDLDQFNKPTDVAVGRGGDVYVTDGYGNSRVVQYGKDGKPVRTWGRKGTGEGEFNTPHSVVLDGRGRVLVGDRENKRVQAFTPEGRFLAAWPEAGAPYGLFLAKDRLFVADGVEQWIKVIDLEGRPLGRFSTGPGEANAPHWVWADTKGALYVAFVHGKKVQKYVVR